MNIALQYARLPERWSEMAVRYAPEIQARVELIVDGGALTAVPEAVDVTGEFGRYTRSVSRGETGDNILIQECNSNLRLRTVPADAYGDFLDYARSVDDVERREISFRSVARP